MMTIFHSLRASALTGPRASLDGLPAVEQAPSIADNPPRAGGRLPSGAVS